MQSFSSLIFRTNSSASGQLIQHFSPSKISRAATDVLKYAYGTATAGAGSLRSYKVAPSFSTLALLSLMARASAQPTYITTVPGMITIPGTATAEEANPIAVGDNDTTVVGAYTNILAPNNLDGLLSQFNTEGGLEGSARFGGPFNDTLRGLCSIPGQGYVGVGATNDLNGSIYHISAVKVSPRLDFEWGLVLSGNGIEGAWAAAAGPEGDVYLTGDSGSTGGAGAQDLFAVKIFSNRTLGWAWLYGGPGQDWGWAITTSKDGHPVAGGHTNNFGVSGADFFVVKLHKDTGALLFTRTFGSSLDQYIRGIAKTNIGRLVAAGWSGSIPSANRDVLVATWEDNGTLHSAYLFGSLADDSASAIAPLATGGVVFAWNTKGFSALHDEMALTEMDENMTVVKSIRSLSTVATRVLGIGIGSDQTIKLSGYTNSSGSLELMTASLTKDWEMYNCSQFESITPNITDVTVTFTSGSPSISSFNWTPNVQVWNNLTAANVTGSAEELCSPEPPPPPPVTTGVVTTGVATTGNLTTGVATTGQVSSSESTNASGTTGVGASPSSSSPIPSPSSSTKESKASTSSPATSNGLAGIIAGVVSAVALVCFAAIAATFYIMRKRRISNVQQNDSGNGVELKAKGSVPEMRGTMPSDRVEGRTTIGGKYDLVRKIDKDEAQQLADNYGIVIPFPEGAHKVKPLFGTGQFGKLRLAVSKETGEFVAVKKIKGAHNIEQSKQEGAMQLMAKGLPNVMPLLDSVESIGSDKNPVLYQFMPLAGFGNGADLKSVLAITTDMGQKQKVLRHVAFSVLTALSGLHKRNLVHFDLKNPNIVLDKNGEVFVIDFGCAQKIKDVHGTNIQYGGDLAYFSPERFDGYRHRKQDGTSPVMYSPAAADLWALGVMLIELMQGGVLFTGDLQERLQKWTPDWMRQTVDAALTKNEGKYPELCDFIRQLTEADTKGIVDASDLLKHPLFKKVEWNFSDQREQQGIFAILKAKSSQKQEFKVEIKPREENEEYADSRPAIQALSIYQKTAPRQYASSPSASYANKPEHTQQPPMPAENPAYALNN